MPRTGTDPALAPPEPVRAEGLTKVHGVGETAVRALDDVTVGFRGGELTAIMGPSGSGKSTLLHCLAALDRPDAGRVLIGERDVARLSEEERTRFRRDHLGIVFQAYNLLPTLTAEENITLPLQLARRRPDQA